MRSMSCKLVATRIICSRVLLPRYMIEGYDHDDIYIMVEDEFHSVAQTFTQHLHHAEYQRLKKKASEATPATFQPTEHMRVEARKKLEARALYAKQKDAVGDITNGVSLSTEEDEEQADDPWLGTSLAGLMTDASAQKRTALVGLEKIQSSTRAARGFGRGMGDGPANRKEKTSVFNIFSGNRKGEESVVEPQEHESGVDDLDFAPRAKAPVSRPTPQRNHRGDESRANREPSSKVIPRSEISIGPPLWTSKPADSRSPSRVQVMAAHKLFDEFDKFEPLDKTSNAAKKSRHSPSRANSKSKQKTERKMQMNDIPTFLV